MQARAAQKSVFFDEGSLQAILAGADGRGVSRRPAADDGNVINGLRQCGAPQYDQMTLGKRLILDQQEGMAKLERGG